MEKLVHIIGFPIISKLIRGETVELSDVCFVPDDQLFNESKNKNFCVKFPIPQTSNTKELAATVPPENGRSQQLQAVIADLSYVDQVIAEQGSIVQKSKCHEMVARSVARLSAMQ